MKIPRVNKKQKCIEAIRQSRGLVSPAARMLGVTRNAIYDMVRKYPEVRQALEESREEMLDVAEGKLFQNIANNDNTAIIFYLKTIGKKRGYVERYEVDNQLALEALNKLADAINKKE